MDFFDLIARRESCRDFSPAPVEREKLIKILEAGIIAPSACNSQPWSFTVVTKKDVALPLAKTLQNVGFNKFADECPAFIVVCEEKAVLASRLSCVLDSQHYAQIDIGIVTAHMALAATAQGLSTCIIGSFDEKALKELLNIPEDKRVRTVLAVGYAREEKEPRAKKRKALEEVARFVEE